MHAFFNLTAFRRLHDVSWIMYKGSRGTAASWCSPKLTCHLRSHHPPHTVALLTVLAMVSIIWSHLSLYSVFRFTLLNAFLTYLLFGDIKYPYVSDSLEPDGSILSLKRNFSEWEVSQRILVFSHLWIGQNKKCTHNWQETEGDKITFCYFYLFTYLDSARYFIWTIGLELIYFRSNLE